MQNMCELSSTFTSRKKSLSTGHDHSDSTLFPIPIDILDAACFRMTCSRDSEIDKIGGSTRGVFQFIPST